MSITDAVWADRYRPKTVDECILPERYKNIFRKMIEMGNGKVPNLLFAGGPGVGKTTTARAICEQLGCEYMIINSSMHGNIDTLRVDIQQFATTSSFSGKRKFVILDEADYMNAQSTQPALRNFMESYQENCGFILTANQPSRIIEPLQSRCTTITFDFLPEERKVIAGEFYKRVLKILEENDVIHDVRVVAEVIKRYFPDFRKILNELQTYSTTGITTGMLASKDESKFQDILTFVRAKDYAKLRLWIGENSAFVYDTAFYTGLYKTLMPTLQPTAIGAAIVIIADYAFKQTTIADREINAMACLSQLMQEATFK